MSSQQERLTAFQPEPDQPSRQVDASAWEPQTRARRCDACGAHVPPGWSFEGDGCPDCSPSIKFALGVATNDDYRGGDR